MALHWQMSFRSLRTDELYTVKIYDDSYNGSVVQLTGADVPFETQEDYDGDMFQPVRTQSGYLRIVDDGNLNWRSIIPQTDTSRPVQLTDSNNNVLWQGFLQAQNFGANLFTSPQIHEFPLQCSLTITSIYKVDYLQTEMQNFAYLLEEILTNIPQMCRPYNIYVQGGSDAQAWLMKKIDWQNFVNIKSDGTTEANKTLYECLESLCRFWGWTARTQGQNLYLTCVDDATEPRFLHLDLTALHSLAVGIEAGTDGGTLETVTFGNDIYASDNNTDFQERGPSKAVVSSDGNTADSDVIKAFPNSVLKTMFAGTIYTENYEDSNISASFTGDIRYFNSYIIIGDCVSSNASFNVMHLYETGTGLSLSKTIADYSVIRIKPTYAQGVSLVQFKTVYEHNFYVAPISGFSYGGLTIFGTVIRQGKEYEYANNRGVGKSTIHMRVGIGKTRNSALWYNGNGSWTSTMNEFAVRIGNTGDYKREQMYGCRTNDTRLQGFLYVDILGSDDMEHLSDTGFIDRFDLVNFRVEFHRNVHAGISSVFDDYERNNSQDYDAFNGTMVDQEWSSSNIFATDKDMEFGYGVLSNPDGTPFTGHSYGGTTMQPEQHLANRVVNYWSTSKRMLSCELRADLAPALTPMNKGTIDGTTLYPVSISRNWRDDIVKVDFMQI